MSRAFKSNIFSILFVALFPSALFCLLFWIYIAPTGERSAIWYADAASPLIGRPLPDARMDATCADDRGSCIAIIDEPVYVSLTPPPGDWTSMDVAISFDAEDQDLLEVGLLQDLRLQRFTFTPLFYRALDTLAWPSTTKTLDNGLLEKVWAKNDDVQDVDAFLANIPKREDIAVYRTAWTQPFRDFSATSLASPRTYDVALRGAHEALMYVQDHEQTTFSVSFVDVNRSYGPDEGFVKIINEAGQTMFEEPFLDDGVISEDQTQSSLRTITFKKNNLPEGVYRISLSSTSDIIWRSITESGSYFVFKNQLFIADDIGFLPQPRATTFWSDVKYLTAETLHAEGLQTLQAGAQALAISGVQEKVSVVIADADIATFTSPVGDVKLIGDGKFALSEDAFFNPDALQVTALPSLADAGVSYVLATIAPTAFTDAGWRQSNASFSLEGAPKEQGAYRLVLSAPRVRDVEDKPKIHEIKVTFKKEPLDMMGILRAMKRFVFRP